VGDHGRVAIIPSVKSCAALFAARPFDADDHIELGHEKC
jgi:hypothetical protein